MQQRGERKKRMHPLIQFQNHNSDILHLICAGLPLSPAAALKRLAGRKHVSKEAISTAKRKLQRSRPSAADCSILSTHDDFLFLHQNDYWIIRYHGARCLATRGLHCLALLHDPGASSMSGTCSPAPGCFNSGCSSLHDASRRLCAGVPVLDTGESRVRMPAQ
jgi:hypothetical protein